LKLFDKLTLNPGLRYDYTGFTSEHNFSPRLGGSLALTQTQTLNFATGIFYQDPLLEDVGDQSTSGRLKNEKTTQFILGYKKYFSEDLKFIVETWYKAFDNLSVRPQSG
jgi:outer membrane receptor protein involved in Fe transport